MKIERALLGTSNRGKLAEFSALLLPADVPLMSLAEIGSPPEVAETGATLADNAALKARAYALHSRQWTLADDTALEVDALGGAPGIYTARYAGTGATPADNRARLLAELADVPPEKRGARFVCELCLADSSGEIRATTRGECRGRIRLAECGDGGFGYDALFEILEYHRTLAELGMAATSVLSHRARAVAAMLPAIRRLLASE